MSEMNNECLKQAEAVRREIEQAYDGKYLDVDGKPVDLWRWASTQGIDYSAIMDSAGLVESVRLYMTLGGPTVWVDTEMRAVVCAWGSDRVSVGLRSDICNVIDGIVTEWMQRVLQR